MTEPRGVVTDVVLERSDGAMVLVGHPNDAYEGPRKHRVEDLERHRWMFATRRPGE